MKRTRFTEKQIVKALKKLEGGRAAEDISREMDISKATLFRWKGKYGGGIRCTRLFELYEVRQLTHAWIEEYNNCRPHESLDNATPKEWADRITREHAIISKQ